MHRLLHLSSRTRVCVCRPDFSPLHLCTIGDRIRHDATNLSRLTRDGLRQVNECVKVGYEVGCLRLHTLTQRLANVCQLG